MDKRQRVLKALALEVPDIVPVHSLGYDRTRQGYADFVNSSHPARLRTIIDGIGDVAEIRWWNADAWQMHPYKVFTSELYPAPLFQAWINMDIMSISFKLRLAA